MTGCCSPGSMIEQAPIPRDHNPTCKQAGELQQGGQPSQIGSRILCCRRRCSGAHACAICRCLIVLPSSRLSLGADNSRQGGVGCRSWYLQGALGIVKASIVACSNALLFLEFARTQLFTTLPTVPGIHNCSHLQLLQEVRVARRFRRAKQRRSSRQGGRVGRRSGRRGIRVQVDHDEGCGNGDREREPGVTGSQGRQCAQGRDSLPNGWRVWRLRCAWPGSPATSGVPPGACPANPTEPRLQERRLPLPTLLLAISRRSSRRLLLRGAVANRNCGAPGEAGAAAAASLAPAGGHRQDCGQQAADALLQGCRNRGMCVVLRHCTACSQQLVQRSEHNPPGPRSSTQTCAAIASQPGLGTASQCTQVNPPGPGSFSSSSLHSFSSRLPSGASCPASWPRLLYTTARKDVLLD